jgi:20S proteasome alpha/beta subunit
MPSLIVSSLARRSVLEPKTHAWRPAALRPYTRNDCIVISTREGFVLATDSRGTSDGTHTDDQQKLFTIGKNSACVIAGLIGSQVGMEGFELRGAMGTQLERIDQRVKDAGTEISLP